MKYEYGVEYKCNGCKPNLEEDVIVEIKTRNFDFADLSAAKVSSIKWGSVLRFRVVDERYKPKPEDKTWFERGELPPVGTVCEVYNHEFGKDAAWEKCKILFMGKFKCVYSSESCLERVGNVDLTGAIEFRPIRTNREKAIEAAAKIAEEHNKSGAKEFYGALYDAGLLRLPEEK